MPVQFRTYFKETAEAETRSITIFEDHPCGLPPGEYGFVELYCDEKNCDCRRVHLLVVADWSNEPIAMIAYGWESPSYYHKWMHFADKGMAKEMSGVSLELMFNQSRYAAAAKKLCEDVLLTDPDYVQRLKRHYQMMRDYVNTGRSSPFSQPSKQKKKTVKKTKSKSPGALVLPGDFRIEKLISPEIVRQALLSPVEAVRYAAANYFDANDIALEIPDCGVMQTVIKAIEKYGYANSLDMIEDRRFPQNEATVRWIVAELDKEHDITDILADNYCFLLAEMLCKVDPGLLAKNMVDLRCFPEEKKSEFLVRLELAGKNWDELWKVAFDYDQENEIEVWEAMARHMDRKEVVLNALQGNDPMISDDLLEEMTPNLIELVEDMKIVEALPWVSQQILHVGKRGFQSIFSDNMMELSNALAVIADEETLNMFCSRWLERPHKHPWFIDVLSRLKTPWSMNACLKVLQKRTLDEYTRQAAIEHLVDNFVSEVLPMVLMFDLELATERSRRQGMVVAHLVNPFDGFDQFEKWKAEAETCHWDHTAIHERYGTQRIRDIYKDDDEADDDDDDFYSDNYDDDDDEIDDENDFYSDYYYARQGDDDDDESEGFEDKDFVDGWDDEVDEEDVAFEESADLGTIRKTKSPVGRNDPCPCGSGKKYKKCCLNL